MSPTTFDIDDTDIVDVDDDADVTNYRRNGMDGYLSNRLAETITFPVYLVLFLLRRREKLDRDRRETISSR